MADWAYAFSLELQDNDTVALGNGGANGNGGNFSGNTIDIATGNTFDFSAAYGGAQEAMHCAPPPPPPPSFSLNLQDNDIVALGNGGENGNGGNFSGNTIHIDTGNDFLVG